MCCTRGAHPTIKFLAQGIEGAGAEYVAAGAGAAYDGAGAGAAYEAAGAPYEMGAEAGAP